jgi:hypothetical protein
LTVTMRAEGLRGAIWYELVYGRER